jgi:soluble lytic murein transglycosylase
MAAVANELHIGGRLAERVTLAINGGSQEFKVSPWLVLALIRVESYGDPSARSAAGAIGLSQIMPETGKQIAEELGVPWEGEKTLLHVETNVRFGCYYLSKLLRRFKGEQRIALAAYNWGPSHISSLLNSGSSIPSGYADKVLSHSI